MVVAQALVYWKARQFSRVGEQQLFGVGAGKNHPPFPVYQQQSLFQMAYDLPKASPHYLKFRSFAGQPRTQLPQSSGYAGDNFVLRQVDSLVLALLQLIDAG